MAEQFWANDPVAQPKGPVVIPNEGAIASDRRDETRTDIAVDNNARDAARFDKDVSKDARQGMGELRKEFTALPEVRKYNTIVQQIDTVLHTAANPAGDQDLLYSIAQLRDPLGSVREGDASLIEGGQPYVEQQIQRLKKNLGSDGTFTPQYRADLRKEAIARLNTANRAYSNLRHQYEEVALTAGYDPKLVVGPHAGAPYVDRFREYDRANQIGQFSPEAIARKAAAGYRPDPSEVQTGFDLPGVESSDITGGRLQPQNEAAWSAFVQASQGDPSFGQAKADAFLKSLGEQGGLSLPPEFIDAVRKGEAVPSGVDYSQSDEARKQAALERSYETVPQGEDPSKFGLDKGISLNLSDELMGVSGGIHDTLTGGSFAQGYERDRDTERALQQRSRESAGLAPELVGGLLTPAGILSKGNMVRDAAAMGAIAGFGEGEGGADSFAKTITGGAVSAIAGKGIEAASPYIAKAVAPVLDKVASSTQKQRDFVDSAANLGLDYMAADVPGNYGTKMATGVTGMTLGGVPLRVAAGKIIDKAQAVKDRIAGKIGKTGDNAETGQSVQRGLREWESATEDRGGKLFGAIPIPAKTEVNADASRTALAELTKGLESNPKLSQLWADQPRLKATLDALTPKDVSNEGARELAEAVSQRAAAVKRFQEAEALQKTLGEAPGGGWASSGSELIAARKQAEAAAGEIKSAQSAVDAASKKAASAPEGGKVTWEDIRGLRSIVGKIVGKPSMTSDGAADAALRKFYGALTDDIGRAAAAHSPEASKAFSRANQYWRGRETRRDQVLQSLLGKNMDMPAEQTTAQIERWASAKGGDFNKLARSIRSLPEDEANGVRAYIVDRMGMAAKGGQDATGEVFSPDIFVTNWNSLSDRSKAILFQGEHRKALDDLATVMSGMKATKVFGNPSGTGYSVWGATNATLAAANPVAFAFSALGQIGSGALLGSPRFARWMAGLAKKPNPSAQLAHIGQLTAIARSEPILANDIFTLQQRLAESFAQPSALRSAAEENDDVGKRPPSNGERNDAP